MNSASVDSGCAGGVFVKLNGKGEFVGCGAGCIGWTVSVCGATAPADSERFEIKRMRSPINAVTQINMPPRMIRINDFIFMETNETVEKP